MTQNENLKRKAETFIYKAETQSLITKCCKLFNNNKDQNLKITFGTDGNCYTDYRSVHLSLIPFLVSDDFGKDKFGMGIFNIVKSKGYEAFWYMMLRTLAAHEVDGHINCTVREIHEAFINEFIEYFDTEFAINKKVANNLGRLLFNIFEDGRIESCIMKRRPGLITQFTLLNWLIRRDARITETPKDIRAEYDVFIGAILSYTKTGYLPNGMKFLNGHRILKELNKILPLIDDVVVQRTCREGSWVMMDIVHEIGEYLAYLVKADSDFADFLESLNIPGNYSQSESNETKNEGDASHRKGAAKTKKALAKTVKAQPEGKSQKEKSEEKTEKSTSEKESSEEKASSNKVHEQDESDESNENHTSSSTDENKTEDGSEENSCSGNEKNDEASEAEINENSSENESEEKGGEDGGAFDENVDSEGDGKDADNSTDDADSKAASPANSLNRTDKTDYGTGADSTDQTTNEFDLDEPEAMSDEEWSEITAQLNECESSIKKEKVILTKHEAREIAIEKKYVNDMSARFAEKNIPPTVEPLPPNMNLIAADLRKKLNKILFIRNKNIRGLTKGSIDTRSLYKIGTRSLDVFQQKQRPAKDFAFYILRDKSGSMSGEKDLSSSQTCAILEEALRTLAPLKITAFCTEGGYVAHYTVREFKDKGKNKSLGFLRNSPAGGGNKDGFSIRIATAELAERSEKEKVLFILSDGLPSDYRGGVSEAMNDVRCAVEEARAKGIKVISIMFGDDNFIERTEESYRYMYQNNILACGPKTLTKTLIPVFQNIFKK